MELGIILGVSLLGLVVAGMLAKWVLAQDMGPEGMQKVANAIKTGAEAFLSRMNGTILKIAVPLAALIYILYAFVRTPTEFDPASKQTLALWTTISFVLGAGCTVMSHFSAITIGSTGKALKPRSATTCSAWISAAPTSGMGRLTTCASPRPSLPRGPGTPRPTAGSPA